MGSTHLYLVTTDTSLTYPGAQRSYKSRHERSRSDLTQRLDAAMGNDYLDNLTITSMLKARFLMRGLTQALFGALLSSIIIEGPSSAPGSISRVVSCGPCGAICFGA